MDGVISSDLLKNEYSSTGNGLNADTCCGNGVGSDGYCVSDGMVDNIDCRDCNYSVLWWCPAQVHPVAIDS